MLTAVYPIILELISNRETDEIERLYAKFVLGAYYYFGLGNIKKDYEHAFNIIKECADHGHLAAIYDMGANFYYNGNGTERNYELASMYLEIAKEAGLPRAIKLLEKRQKS